MRNIKVSYDGKYPCSCFGKLIVVVDGEEIYNKEYCCSSTGSVSFDSDWNEIVCCGELLWNDAEKYDIDIRYAVKEVLNKIEVCCGGCV